ncbi:uncharacterized protein LOC116133839 [Pistacia vera]|uniref:uncharacterized protein LOC116133839 n=1 Tax=Pistacia vera TaxID=55513 RepID=UPI00126360C4|nr:uncharacterized protein LOC116133839 [Pistacia vera]
MDGNAVWTIQCTEYIHAPYEPSVLAIHRSYTQIRRSVIFSLIVAFLGYIVSTDGIRMDLAKIEAITSWPTPKNIHDIRSFHGLASFYRRFIRNFSTIIAPIIECLKAGRFVWTKEAKNAFQLLKSKVIEASVLVLANFGEVFEVHCDTSNVEIREALS